MNQLRQLMLEELRRRNFADTTIRTYLHGVELWNCPLCGATMRVVERLSAAQLLLRSPPQPDRCPA